MYLRGSRSSRISTKCQRTLTRQLSALTIFRSAFVRITEEYIVQQLVLKNKEAIALIYDQYGDALYGVILRMTGDEAIARDVLQESLIKIWKQGRSYDQTKAKLFTWMMRICRNAAIDQMRKEQTRNAHKIQMASSAVYEEQSTSFKPEHMDVPEKVMELEGKYREVIDALFFNGLTQQEASEALNIPLGTVKTRLKIAMRELRKVFNEHPR